MPNSNKSAKIVAVPQEDIDAITAKLDAPAPVAAKTDDRLTEERIAGTVVASNDEVEAPDDVPDPVYSKPPHSVERDLGDGTILTTHDDGSEEDE